MTNPTPAQNNLEEMIHGFSNYDVLCRAKNKPLVKHSFSQMKAQFVMTLTGFHPDIDSATADAVCEKLGKTHTVTKRVLDADAMMAGVQKDNADYDEMASSKDESVRFTLCLLTEAINDIIASKSPVITGQTRENLTKRLQFKKDLT